jgi:hypothetical protein
MEILPGQIIVCVNLDEVIRIIREGDDPKAEMIVRWELSEVQAEAILNMRLRALSRLEGDRDPQGAGRAHGRGGAAHPVSGEREKTMAGGRQGGRGDRRRDGARRLVATIRGKPQPHRAKSRPVAP